MELFQFMLDDVNVYLINSAISNFTFFIHKLYFLG